MEQKIKNGHRHKNIYIPVNKKGNREGDRGSNKGTLLKERKKLVYVIIFIQRYRVFSTTSISQIEWHSFQNIKSQTNKNEKFITL